jgi:hypothetical protein
MYTNGHSRIAQINIYGAMKLEDVCIAINPTNSSNEVLIQAVLPSYHEDALPSAIAPIEVTKTALRLRYLIEETVSCELEEDSITRANSKVITRGVIAAAREAGGKEHRACVVYALLVCKRWFKKQAMLELWDADLHNVRATACEVIAKQL